MSNPKIFLQPELIEGDNIDIAQDGKTISSNTPLENITDTNITEVEDGQALIYDETSGKWVNGEGGTPIEPNPAAAATDTLSTIKIDNTVFSIGGGGTGDAVLYPLTTAEYNALTPEQKMDENVLYLLTDGGSGGGGGGGTGSGYSETVLWENASGQSFVNSPAITLTLNDDISNYDMLMFELAPSDNLRWRYHNIALTQNIDKTGTNYFGSVTIGGTEGYAPGITYIDETSLSFHSWGQAYSLTIYKIIGIKFGGGGGSNVIPNPEDETTDILHSIKIDDATYAIQGGGSFIDVENRIVALTEFTTSLTYTATEDCVVCMYLVCPGDASTFVKINDFTVQNFWQAELATGPCAPIFVRAGQTLTVTGAHTTYTSNYTVYGVQSSGGGGGTGNLNAVEMDYEDWLALPQEEREDPNIEYFLNNAPGGGSGSGYEETILFDTQTTVSSGSNLTLNDDYTNYDMIIIDASTSDIVEWRDFVIINVSQMALNEEHTRVLLRTSSALYGLRYKFTSATNLYAYGDGNRGIIIYKIVGIKFGGGGGGSFEVSYSTEEQRIGTWIDGKPLYQKTLFFNNIEVTMNDSTSEAIHGIDDIEMGWVEEVLFKDTSGVNSWVSVKNTIAWTASSTMQNILWRVGNRSIYAHFYPTNSITKKEARSFYITIRYTKTTD